MAHARCDARLRTAWWRLSAQNAAVCAPRTGSCLRFRALQTKPYPSSAAPPIQTVLDCSTDVHVADAVRSFILQFRSTGASDAAAGACEQFAALQSSLPRALDRCMAASEHALEFSYALRSICGDKRQRSSAWAKALDAAVVDRLRVLFSPACVPLTQLSLPSPSSSPHASYMQPLLAAAEAGETVHRTNDPTAFKRKLGHRRMIHALSHASARHELLAVLYSAIMPGMPASMAQIDAMSGGEPNPDRGHWDVATDLVTTRGGAHTRASGVGTGAGVLPATTVAFYSVSAQHAGTRGLRMGTRIIYATAGHIAAHAPEVRTFCTMSPIPGFVDWVEVAASLGKLHPLLADASTRAAIDETYTRVTGEATGSSSPELAARRLSHMLVSATPRWHDDPRNRAALQPVLTSLVRHYLLLPSGSASGGPSCKVAAFHLGNGARLHRIAWGADPSPAGLKRSASLMVNYLYSNTGGDGLHDTMFNRAAEYVRSPGDVLRAQAPILA